MEHRTMRVTFHKRGRTCGWTAVRPPRSIVPGPTMAAGGDLPHDLYTFVIEDALGLEHGFWGCIAAGATFRTLGRKRTPQGKAVIARHLDDLDAAEARVNEIYFAWRAGTPTDLDPELDAMLARWRALSDGADLDLEWPLDRTRRRTRRAATRQPGTHRRSERAPSSGSNMSDAPGPDPAHPAARRVADTLGADASTALRDGLPASDLTSLLLDVMRRRASRRSPADIVRQYEADRFTRPAEVDPRALLAMSSKVVDSLPPGFELVETAPLVPLGTHSVITGISQHRVVTTIRSTEVAADPTSSLALEAAVRRRTLLRHAPKSTENVQLASIDRVVRAQQFDGHRSFAHFTLLGLVTAGRDTGRQRFEAEALSTHLQALSSACRTCGHNDLVVQLTDFGGSSGAVVDACTSALRGNVAVETWPDRPSGRDYYSSVCFKLSVIDDDETIEVADGGIVDWTQQLLGTRKERLMISGLSLERLAQLVTPARP